MLRSLKDTSPRLCSKRHNEYLFGRAKIGDLGQVTTQKNNDKNEPKKNKKSPRGIRPRRCSPPPPTRDVKYVTVTQDKSPCLCRKRHDEYLFDRAKTGGLGQVTTKKQEKPQGHWTPPFFPSPGGAKYITVTQDTSLSGLSF